MSREDDLGLVGLVVPEAETVILTSAQQVLVALGDVHMAHRVRVALEEAHLLNLEVLGVEGELSHQLVLGADQESARLGLNASAAIGDVGALVGLDCLMLDDVHVVLEADNRGISFKSCQQDVLVVGEEVTAENH